MENISTGVLFTLLVLLILISAYFSSSETGMMSINRYRLRHLANQGHPGAQRVEKLLARPDRLIGLILIGNNLVNILASAISTIIGLRLFGDMGVAIATGALTLIILVFAEVTPKTLATVYPEKIAFISSLLLIPLMKLLYPLVWTVNGITMGLMRLLGLNTQANAGSDLNTEELRTVVNEAGGLIPRSHQRMLLSILELEELVVEDIMVPRHEIIGININDDWKAILRQLTHAPHARMVLYRDHIDQVVGILRVREAYRMMVENSFDKANLLRAVDEAYYIPEGTALHPQLLKFQRNKERMGIVVNEYGDMIGLVTLDDILEEIVGEFTTSLSPNLSEEITTLPDGHFLVKGTASVRALNRSFDWSLPTNGARTLNGLLLEHLEDIPSENTRLRIAGQEMQIVHVADNRIKQVKVLNLTTK